MSASIVEIRPRGRFELFERSGLYDMYVATHQREWESSAPCPRKCGACRARSESNLSELVRCSRVEMIDVDMAGNCVSLGFVDSTTLIPNAEPEEAPETPTEPDEPTVEPERHDDGMDGSAA